VAPAAGLGRGGALGPTGAVGPGGVGRGGYHGGPTHRGRRGGDRWRLAWRDAQGRAVVAWRAAAAVQGR
jgi:hypothetical protein